MVMEVGNPKESRGFPAQGRGGGGGGKGYMASSPLGVSPTLSPPPPPNHFKLNENAYGRHFYRVSYYQETKHSTHYPSSTQILR